MKRRSIRLAGALAATGLALGLTLGATGTARADVTPPANTWSEIYNPYLNAQGFSLCADDANASSAVGNPVQLYHCHGYASNGAPQRWRFQLAFEDANHVPINNGIYIIGNDASPGHCLDAQRFVAGAPLTLGACFIFQYWKLVPIGAGPDFQLQEWASDSAPLCVAASNFTGNNNTRLMAEPCSLPDTRQRFRLG
jgi:hypothetical protein